MPSCSRLAASAKLIRWLLHGVYYNQSVFFHRINARAHFFARRPLFDVPPEVTRLDFHMDQDPVPTLPVRAT